MPKLIASILSVASHRNGCLGAPFHVVTFTVRDGRQHRAMVAAIFDAPGLVSVLDIEKLSAGDVAFGSNSWRGDDFEPELRQAVAEYEAGRDADMAAWLAGEAAREAETERLLARRRKAFASITRAERACFTRNRGATAERRRAEARDRLARANAAYAAIDAKINALHGESHA